MVTKVKISGKMKGTGIGKKKEHPWGCSLMYWLRWLLSDLGYRLCKCALQVGSLVFVDYALFGQLIDPADYSG